MYPKVRSYTDATNSEAVLAVSLPRDDHRALSDIFSKLPWTLKSAATLAQGLIQVMSRPVAAIVCEQDLPGGSWRLLLDKVEMLPRPPRVIVASRLADARLWAEVLNLGGYDVLATPFDANEVHYVLSYAVESWQRQAAPIAKSASWEEYAVGPQASYLR